MPESGQGPGSPMGMLNCWLFSRWVLWRAETSIFSAKEKAGLPCPGSSFTLGPIGPMGSLTFGM